MKKILVSVLVLEWLFFCCFCQAAESEQWNKTLQKVADSVVSIRINVVRTFDTENSMVSQATGFVVDAKNGIILTNRHVVNPGPITAEAIFSNSEEVELIPIYRDPVHDFGFFKYDPKKLKFITPQALKLVDNKAKVGDEIRVIGNDSGEQMSILSGTLARLDRSAPRYRAGGYNDFNTFYFQAAADTSGGSSGSPVINENGEVLALNAGGQNSSSSSYFLPLFKITRALKQLQNKQVINRGTLQMTLSYQTYDQVRRLGLSSQLEKAFRDNTKGNGLLVVEKTVLGGPSDKILRPGDIILSIKSANKKLDYVSRYEEFEIFLDEHVEQAIELKISRGGTVHQLLIKVADLHLITPDEYIEIGGAILNNFSYQLARQTNLAVGGVYISSPGFIFANAGVSPGSVIHGINSERVDDLDDLQQALSKLKQNEYVTLKYVNIATPTKQQVANVKFQTNWHFSARCKRDDQNGLWPCQKLTWNSEEQIIKPAKIKFNDANISNKNIENISRSLVMVQAYLPYQIDGQNYPAYSGTGLVLDVNSGLIVVDRNTVPIKMAQVKVTFASSVEVPAKVLFVHPLHNFSLLQVDPKLLAGSEIQSAKLSDRTLEVGEAVWLVGYQTSNRLISEKLTVSSNDPLILPSPPVPQFRETNINSVIINNPPHVASGVLLDKKNKIVSWWTNFAFGQSTTQTIDRGLPIKAIIELRDQWLKHGRLDVYSLEVELTPLSISKARNFGLSDDWMSDFQGNGHKQQVLQVLKTVAGSDASRQLKEGDLLLAINDQLVSDFSDLDRETQFAEVKVSVWRDNQQIDLNLKTQLLSDNDTEQIYLWSGALIQTPHRAVAVEFDVEAKGVYISWYWFGSPANHYGLRPLNRITEIEGEQVENIEQFITLTRKYFNHSYLRIRMIDLIGRESMITLKQDHHYWPTQKIYLDGDLWKNVIVD